MTDKRAMWTYYKGEWREGDVRILGAASQATWLGSLVFDGARLFEGVTPDLDRHSARANDSARALGLEPTLSANDIEALAREGLKNSRRGRTFISAPCTGQKKVTPAQSLRSLRQRILRSALRRSLWSSPRGSPSQQHHSVDHIWKSCQSTPRRPASIKQCAHAA